MPAPPTMRPTLAAIALLVAIARSAAPQVNRLPQPTALLLRWFGTDSLPMLDVDLGGRVRPFILDLGAGITVISKALCDTLDCRPAGRLAGVRHTGEVLEFPLAILPSLRLGPITLSQTVVATMDLTPWQQVGPVAGVLSLQVLEHTPFTLNLPHHQLIIESTRARGVAASSPGVPVALIREHPSTVTLAVPFFLAGERLGWGTIDTGSPQTYVHVFWKDLLGQHGRLRYVREQQGWTGQRDSVQYWSISGLAVLDSTTLEDSVTIAVRRMVPDGLIGLDWLRRRILSCDLEALRCAVR